MSHTELAAPTSTVSISRMKNSSDVYSTETAWSSSVAASWNPRIHRCFAASSHPNGCTIEYMSVDSVVMFATASWS